MTKKVALFLLISLCSFGNESEIKTEDGNKSEIKTEDKEVEKLFSLTGNFYVFLDEILPEKKEEKSQTNFSFFSNWHFKLIFSENFFLGLGLLGEQKDRTDNKISFFENHIITSEEAFFIYKRKYFELAIGRLNIPYTISNYKIKPVFLDDFFHFYKLKGQQGLNFKYLLTQRNSLSFSLFSRRKEDNLAIIQKRHRKSFAVIFSREIEDSKQYKSSIIFTEGNDGEPNELRYSLCMEQLIHINELEYFSYLSEFIEMRELGNDKKEYFFSSGISYSIAETDLTLLSIWNKETKKKSLWRTQISLGLKKNSQEHIALAYLFSNEKHQSNIFRLSYRYSF